MAERRAFTDEAVRDTLPNERLELTNRDTLDLSPNIAAQNAKGAFFSPEIGTYLAKISMDVHDTRRASRDKDFTNDLTARDSEEELQNYKRALTQEYKAKAFVTNFTGQKSALLADQLASSENTEVLKEDIYNDFRSNMEKEAGGLYQQGYIYLADQVRAWTEDTYNRNIKGAIESDLRKNQQRLVLAQDTNWNAGATQIVMSGKASTLTFEDFIKSNLYGDIAQSAGVNSYDDLQNASKRFNTAGITFANGIYLKFQNGLISPDEAVDQLALLASTYSRASVKGFRALTSADRAMIESRGEEYFNQFYGTKVQHLSEEELLAFERENGVSYYSRPGILDSMERDENGNILVVEENWDVSMDENTLSSIAQTIQTIKSKGAGSASLMTLEAYSTVIDLDGLKKGEIAENNYISGRTLAQMDTDLYSMQQNLKYIVANGSPSQIESATSKFKDYFVYGRGAMAAHEFLKYASSIGWIQNGTPPSKEYYSRIQAIKDKYLLGNAYIPDSIPELIFSDKGLTGMNLNAPTKLLESFGYTDEDRQIIKRAYLTEFVKAQEKMINSFSAGGNINKVRTEAEYQSGLSKVKSNLFFDSLVSVNKTTGAMGVNAAGVQALTKELTNLSNYTFASTNDKNTPTAFIDTVSNAFNTYKSLGTTKQKEIYAMAVGHALSSANRADAFVLGNYANFTPEQKTFCEKAISYAFLKSTPTMYKYKEQILNNEANGTYGGYNLGQLDDLIRNKGLVLQHANRPGKLSESVYSLVNKYNVEPEYRVSLYRLAAEMASSRTMSKEANKTFDLRDFEEVLKANFDEHGEYKNASPYATPNGTNGINTQSGYNAQRDQFKRDFRSGYNSGEYKYDGNTGNLLLKYKDGNTLQYFNGNTYNNFNIYKATGGINPVKAVEQKRAIGVAAYNLSGLSRVSNDVSLQRKISKQLPKGYTQEGIQVVANSLLSQLARPEVQEGYLKWSGDPNRKSLVGKVDENVVDFIARYATQGSAISMPSDVYGKVKDIVRYTYMTKSNPNTISAYHRTDVPRGKEVPLKVNDVWFGHKVTSSFGEKRDDGSTHKGTDFAYRMNENIAARASGKVIEVGFDRNGYGNYVKIDQGKGHVVIYGHMSTPVVRKGQTIRQGEVIGRAGVTGHAKGPHLHYELRIKGVPVEPKTHKNLAGERLSLVGEGMPTGAAASITDPEAAFYKSQVTQDSLKKSKDMGYYQVEMQDAVHIFDTLSDYKTTKEDAEAVGRTLGKDIDPTDDWQAQNILVARLGMARKIFSNTNPDDSQLLSLASIYPGTTLKFVTYEKDTLVSGKTLNDIIRMRKEEGLSKYSEEVGSWQLDKYSPKLKKWLDKYKDLSRR